MRTVRSVHSPATGAMPCGRRHRRRAGSLRNWTHPLAMAGRHRGKNACAHGAIRSATKDWSDCTLVCLILTTSFNEWYFSSITNNNYRRILRLNASTSLRLCLQVGNLTCNKLHKMSGMCNRFKRGFLWGMLGGGMYRKIQSNPIQCVVTGAGSPLCPHRTTEQYDHIKIGTLPVPVKSATRHKNRKVRLD